MSAARVVGVARLHALFLGLLAAGALLRVATQLAYVPALFFFDSFNFLRLADTLDPTDNKALGYVVLVLRPLLTLHDLAVFPLVHHVLGLGMAVALYLLCLRLGVRRWLAALATAPVLLDSYQLVMEQYLLSDVVFQALLVAVLLVLLWRVPVPRTAAIAGLLLGTAATVRFVGVPLVVPVVVYLLLAVPGRWRLRLLAAALAAATFAVPLGGYALWFHHQAGEWGLQGNTGRNLYARAATIADCAGLEGLPDYQRVLCPTSPPEQRPGVNDYLWSDASQVGRVTPPPGTTKGDAARAFALRVFRQQALDLAGAIARDFLFGFTWPRERGALHPPLDRWQFQVAYNLREDSGPRRDPVRTVEKYGGAGPYAREALTRPLQAYQQSGGYTPGPVLLAALLVAVLGALGVGRARRSELRPACLLSVGLGAGVLLSAAALMFSWRYQLPGLVLLPFAGALGITALTRRQEEPDGPLCGG